MAIKAPDITRLEETVTAAPAAPKPTASAMVILEAVTLVLAAPPKTPLLLYCICIVEPPGVPAGAATHCGVEPGPWLANK